MYVTMSCVYIIDTNVFRVILVKLESGIISVSSGTQCPSGRGRFSSHTNTCIYNQTLPARSRSYIIMLDHVVIPTT